MSRDAVAVPRFAGSESLPRTISCAIPTQGVRGIGFAMPRSTSPAGSPFRCVECGRSLAQANVRRRALGLPELGTDMETCSAACSLARAKRIDRERNARRAELAHPASEPRGSEGWWHAIKTVLLVSAALFAGSLLLCGDRVRIGMRGRYTRGWSSWDHAFVASAAVVLAFWVWAFVNYSERHRLARFLLVVVAFFVVRHLVRHT